MTFPDSGSTTHGASSGVLVCSPSITGYPGPGTIWRPDLWLASLKGSSDEAGSTA
jgi:hypothetical protein